MKERELLSDLISQEVIEAIAKDTKTPVEDIYLVRPSLTEYLSFAANPQLMSNPAAVLRATIKTAKRKNIMEASKIAAVDINVYSEAYMVAMHGLKQLKEEQDEKAKKLGVWVDPEEEEPTPAPVSPESNEEKST